MPRRSGGANHTAPTSAAPLPLFYRFTRIATTVRVAQIRCLAFVLASDSRSSQRAYTLGPVERMAASIEIRAVRCNDLIVPAGAYRLHSLARLGRLRRSSLGGCIRHKEGRSGAAAICVRWTPDDCTRLSPRVNTRA